MNVLRPALVWLLEPPGPSRRVAAALLFLPPLSSCFQGDLCPRNGPPPSCVRGRLQASNCTVVRGGICKNNPQWAGVGAVRGARTRRWLCSGRSSFAPCPSSHFLEVGLQRVLVPLGRACTQPSFAASSAPRQGQGVLGPPAAAAGRGRSALLGTGRRLWPVAATSASRGPMRLREGPTPPPPCREGRWVARPPGVGGGGGAMERAAAAEGGGTRRAARPGSRQPSTEALDRWARAAPPLPLHPPRPSETSRLAGREGRAFKEKKKKLPLPHDSGCAPPK